MNPDNPADEIDPIDPPDPAGEPADEEMTIIEDFDGSTAVGSSMDEMEKWIFKALFGASQAATVVSSSASKAISLYTQSYYDKTPYHTSILTGLGWVNELLTGHPDRIRCELGVRRHVFYVLLSLLRDSGCRDSKFVTLEEQLAIFLYAIVTGLSTRHLGEQFQRSNETISKYFKRILNAFASPPIYQSYVQLPRADDPIPLEILQNPKYYPYFADAIGAIDGTHIPCHPDRKERDAARNRKGTFTQNCLAACTFNMSFLYILSGWEGSAADARVYYHAWIKDFNIPAGKYYFADTGFGACDELLVPYRNVRYHLAEWGRGCLKPCNHGELFNLRHTMLRNVIERIFGVLKNRFRILSLPPFYPMSVQARIPPAVCLVHNVIRVHDPDDMMDYRRVENDDDDRYAGPEHHTGMLAEGPPSDEARTRAHDRRDAIARQMWADYNRVRQERGESVVVDDLE